MAGIEYYNTLMDKGDVNMYYLEFDIDNYNREGASMQLGAGRRIEDIWHNEEYW